MNLILVNDHFRTYFIFFFQSLTITDVTSTVSIINTNRLKFVEFNECIESKRDVDLLIVEFIFFCTMKNTYFLFRL